MGYSDITIIIPTLNEARNIGDLLMMLLRSYKGAKAIVADDGSGDGTRGIVQRIGRKHRSVIFLDRRSSGTHGLTASVLDAALNVKTAYFVVMDGDMQHPPEKVAEIVEKLRRGCDIVIGTRTKVEGGWPAQRKLMSVIATTAARIRLMKNVKDPMSGFFGAKAGLLRKAIAKSSGRFEREGYKALFDLLKILPNAKTCEVPYVFGERLRGESKIGQKQVFSFVRSLLK